VKYLFIPLAILLIFASCATEDNSPSTNPNAIPEGMTGETKFIGSEGGDLYLVTPNGEVSITIPPGALDSLVEISVYTPEAEDLDQIKLVFEPDGLEFLTPIELKVGLTNEHWGNHTLASLWLVSELNPIIQIGSEEHRWERMKNVQIDDIEKTLSAEMDHFSTGLVLLGIERNAYMIFDIPGKYLKPGDILFVLSSSAASYEYHWVPGHVGMVNSVNPDTSHPDGDLQVIESTLGGGPGGNINGVQINPFLRFKRSSGHLYMGARRPLKYGGRFTDDERKTVVSFARSKFGFGYGYLGGTQPNRFTCSGLVQDAMNKAGKTLYPSNTEILPTPVEEFEQSSYVDSITIRVGEELQLPIYPVVVDKLSSLTTSTGFYVAGNPLVGGTLTLESGKPNDATFVQDNTHVYRAQVFKWSPKPTDAGKTIELKFSLVGSVALDNGQTAGYTIYKSFFIKVRGASTKLDIFPAGKGESGLTYTNFFPIPPNAIIGPNSMDHLIDSATGLHPINPIFTNQIMDKYEEKWLDPNDKKHFGVSLHIKRLDPPFDPPPKGRKTWYYSVDYRLPFYTGQ
jgi:hypothetical protein